MIYSCLLRCNTDKTLHELNFKNAPFMLKSTDVGIQPGGKDVEDVSWDRFGNFGC